MIDSGPFLTMSILHRKYDRRASGTPGSNHFRISDVDPPRDPNLTSYCVHLWYRSTRTYIKGDNGYSSRKRRRLTNEFQVQVLLGVKGCSSAIRFQRVAGFPFCKRLA